MKKYHKSFKKRLHKVILFTIGLVSFSLLAIADEPVAVKQNIEEQNKIAVEKIDATLKILDKRLNLMNEVAKWKWNNAAPIEDPKHEKAILEEIREKSISIGVQPRIVADIFQAQINAGKLIQIRDFEEWVKKDVEELKDVPDLKTKLKPQIESINTELLTQIKETAPLLEKHNYKSMIEERAKVLIQGKEIDDQVRETAIEPLLNLYREAKA